MGIVLFIVIVIVIVIVGVASASSSSTSSYSSYSSSSSSSLDSSTQKFVNDVKDVANNRSTYISLATAKGNGDLINELYAEFDSLFAEYMNSLYNHTAALMGQRDALHSHKIDPYIAGGAASSLGGLGAGLIAAGGAASHNQNVDDKRAYYNAQVSQTSYSQTSLQNQLSTLVSRIRYAAGKY